MSPKERLLIISLTEKIRKNPDYAKQIGIELQNNKIPFVKSETEKISV